MNESHTQYLTKDVRLKEHNTVKEVLWPELNVCGVLSTLHFEVGLWGDD